MRPPELLALISAWRENKGIALSAVDCAKISKYIIQLEQIIDKASVLSVQIYPDNDKIRQVLRGE